ncbi:chemotaxis protein CheR [Wenzhouxiangella sp. C33]|uniref:protein-glutamate O-methyltransferase n=2 Tax=Wenzhouxiangella limi TaxID=2707351 RepID=A0A845UV69_9GAMM|nr:chemotaxis protein CheR [Wenzhouxiangella limi]
MNEATNNADVMDQGPSQGGAFPGYVVGIGASAGGLEALEHFFSHCPSDTGAAFVVVQHLSPDHKSMMSNLLARHTDMPVQIIEDGLRLQPNEVFLIPPGHILTIEEDRLYLKPKRAHGLTLPIDIFLTSLARAYGSHAVGVILSGTGSDGTRGAVEINAAAGFLVAQDPREAKFDGMPSSVINTGVVDAVLSANDLPERLQTHFLKCSDSATGDSPDALPAIQGEDAFEGIMQLLRQIGGIAFSDYKPSTVIRRIERRMQVRQAESLDDYLSLLEKDRGEAVTLRRELLIPVTSFFRDPQSFDRLAEKAVRKIVSNAAAGDQIRVWVAGCSTGEEAYSIAILFLEAFERYGRRPSLKVFATDVNEQGIELAGNGQYPDSAAAELTPERIERFFTRSGHSYTVSNELRQCIVFARHNLLTDPPFTRMDLVSCRNALIYFKREAQSQAVRRLQYALKPGGFLFLGPSESMSGMDDAFETVDSKHKIYSRTAVSLPPVFAMDVAGGFTGQARKIPPPDEARSQRRSRDSALIDYGVHELLEAYAPPSILVNDKHEAVHLFGQVQRFIRMREGLASLDLNRILVEPLVPVASALLYKVAKDGTRLVSSPVTLDLADGERVVVHLSVRPLRREADERYMLLSFEAREARDDVNDPEPVDVGAENSAHIEMLEHELAATRESLQATIEELETANEELQATNEELMASNEELQSSNEELQSVNEELNTVNAEYQEKVQILNRLNADLDSMEKAVGIATVFVDQDLQVNRFSPDAVDLFRLRPSDIGRPLDEIAHSIRHPGLTEDLRKTLRSERLIEREVTGRDGSKLLMRILPYRVSSSSAVGAVASFIDVTAVHDLKEVQSVLDALPEHIAVLEVDGNIALVNEAWRRFARANGDPDLVHSGPGSNYFRACRADGGEDEEGSASAAAAGLKNVLEGSRTEFSLRYPCHSPTEQRWFVMNVAPVNQGPFAAVVSHINITDWYRSERDGSAGAD